MSPSGNPTGFGPLDPVIEEALERLVHLHSGAETAQDWAEYEAWQASSTERAAAARQAEKLWAAIGPALAERKKKPRGPTSVAIVAAAAIGLAAMIGSVDIRGHIAYYTAEQRTGLGERRTITTPDGSTVELDTETSVDVDPAGRLLTLHGGQIFVSVKPVPDRPFIVRSGRGRTESSGASLDIRRADDRTQVVALNETVLVSSVNPNGSPVDLTLLSGQEVSYSSATGMGIATASDLRARTAWRQGQMRFSERPLGEVFDEMSRYRRGTVVFLDRELRELPVTGTFETGDTEAMLDALSAIAPVTLTRLPFLTVVRRSDGQKKQNPTDP